MSTHRYPSDLTEAQWALVEPLIPTESGGGRPRKTAPRDALDAILCAGCRWRYLPGDLPPESTFRRHFRVRFNENRDRAGGSAPDVVSQHKTVED